MPRQVLPRALTIVSLAASAALACAGCGEGGHTDAHAEDGGTSDGHTHDAPPEAPVLDAVAAMGGGLHVAWTAKGSCDAIEGERKKEKGAFAAAFSVAGTATNYMDDNASSDSVYTYRLRCKHGDELSAYSNELSGNPKK